MQITRRFIKVCLWASTALPILASSNTFQQDVILRGDSSGHEESQHHLRRAILQRAQPIADYQAMLQAQGMGMNIVTEAEETERRLQDNNAQMEMFSFSGYSLKYAKCQPVQFFSQNALTSGMRSPMLVQDVVVLRLCPYKSCTSSREYGCHYNFAEYAISLPDYVQIMMEHYAMKRTYLCNYCTDCIASQGGRRLEDAAAAGDEAAAEANNEANNGYQAQQQAACNQNVYKTYCSDYANMCSDDAANDAEGKTEYFNYDVAKNYMQCAQVNYNDYAYFVRPYCNPQDGTIAMGVYFDDFCAESANAKVQFDSLNLGFDNDLFDSMYSGECVDCSENDQAPLYDVNSVMCNIIHADSAKCTNGLTYDLFDGEYSTYDSNRATECAFIESLRFGVYDEYGLMSSQKSTSSWTYAPTTAQKVMLGLSITLCVGFIMYACYLHHAMTNLLIKSLSHRELLPPSRHKSHNRSNSVSRRGRVGNSGISDDWNE